MILGNNKKRRKRRRTKMYGEEQFVAQFQSFFVWIQEFSKKIVFGAFLIYITTNIFTFLMIYLAFLNSGDVLSLDTLIIEANTTFRDVIGGYIIKALTENAIKISGSLIDKYIGYFLEKKYGIKNTEETNNEEEVAKNESIDDPDYIPTENIDEMYEEFIPDSEEDYPEDELKAAYE